jgi:hypothetical protein
LAITNFLVNLILADYFSSGSTQYVALHISDPTNAGLADTELSTVSAPTYTRQAVTWSSPVNRGIYNTNLLSWLALPVVSIGYLAVWDAATGGHLLAVFPAKPTFDVTTAGGSIKIPAQSIAVVMGGSPDGRADLATGAVFPDTIEVVDSRPE